MINILIFICLFPVREDKGFLNLEKEYLFHFPNESM